MWEERTTLGIGHTVVVVEAINIRNTQILHRLLLNQADPLQPLVYTRSTTAWSIQDRTHLPFRNQRVEHRLINLPEAPCITLIDVDRECTKLVDNLLIGLLQYRIHLFFRPAILLHHTADLLTVHLCILDRHLAHHVEIQFEHLADLLVERHFGKCFLYFRLKGFITWNSRFLLCHHTHRGTNHYH